MKGKKKAESCEYLTICLFNNDVAQRGMFEVILKLISVCNSQGQVNVFERLEELCAFTNV